MRKILITVMLIISFVYFIDLDIGKQDINVLASKNLRHLTILEKHSGLNKIIVYVKTEDKLANRYTQQELDKLFRIVEAETTGCDFKSKCNVVSVIFNRISSEKFGNNIDSVLTESQFSPFTDGRYYSVNVTEETIMACEYVYTYGDTTNGALFFDATKGNSWAARNKEYIMTDSSGHNFYK